MTAAGSLRRLIGKSNTPKRGSLFDVFDPPVSELCDNSGPRQSLEKLRRKMSVTSLRHRKKTPRAQLQPLKNDLEDASPLPSLLLLSSRSKKEAANSPSPSLYSDRAPSLNVTIPHAAFGLLDDTTDMPRPPPPKLMSRMNTRRWHMWKTRRPIAHLNDTSPPASLCLSRGGTESDSAATSSRSAAPMEPPSGPGGMASAGECLRPPPETGPTSSSASMRHCDSSGSTTSIWSERTLFERDVDGPLEPWVSSGGALQERVSLDALTMLDPDSASLSDGVGGSAGRKYAQILLGGPQVPVEAGEAVSLRFQDIEYEQRHVRFVDDYLKEQSLVASSGGPTALKNDKAPMTAVVEFECESDFESEDITEGTRIHIDPLEMQNLFLPDDTVLDDGGKYPEPGSLSVRTGTPHKVDVLPTYSSTCKQDAAHEKTHAGLPKLPLQRLATIIKTAMRLAQKAGKPSLGLALRQLYHESHDDEDVRRLLETNFCRAANKDEQGQFREHLDRAMAIVESSRDATAEWQRTGDADLWALLYELQERDVEGDKDKEQQYIDCVEADALFSLMTSMCQWSLPRRDSVLSMVSWELGNSNSGA